MATTREIVRLKSFIRKHGKAKTAVALGMKETNSINNWISRGFVPDNKKGQVNFLNNIGQVITVHKHDVV